jgi:hypothetical protein
LPTQLVHRTPVGRSARAIDGAYPRGGVTYGVGRRGDRHGDPRLRAVDTAARSLAHWSEGSRGEMDAFYALARRDYERLARGFISHPAWLRRVAAGRRRITLLDVACGSGKFPQALQDFGGVGALSGELQIAYELLDPSCRGAARLRRRPARGPPVLRPHHRAREHGDRRGLPATMRLRRFSLPAADDDGSAPRRLGARVSRRGRGPVAVPSGGRRAPDGPGL